jgi:SAM-dependent methyltransferase
VRRLASLLPPGRVIDVGCGYGRWFPLTAPGRSLVGIDFAPALVERANSNPQDVPVSVGDVRSLPFADGEFDAVYTIKVLQCLPQSDRAGAVAELFRVVRRGGTVLLYEKTLGGDGSPSRDWITAGRSGGGRLIAWYGNHYVPLHRLVASAAELGRRLVAGRPSHDEAEGDDAACELRTRLPRLFAVYASLDSFALGVSVLLEPVSERVFPRSLAQHGIFHFVKG